MSGGFPTRRAWAVAALLVVGALDLHTTAVGLRAHARLRERTLSGLRQATVQARPRLSALVAPGGPEAAQQTAAAAVDAGLASTAEVFRLDGTRIAAAPALAGSRHWPLERDLPRLRAGEVLTMTQLAAVPPRVFAYALLPSAGGPVLLRVAADAADLVADLRDRQETFVTQALGLLLVLATMALLAPPRAEAGAATPPVGLIAYEEAMGRLRARDEEMVRLHQLERSRMEGELRDNAPFVRAGELTVGIVHEVRNGLGTILGYARLVQSAGGPGAEHARGIVEECETLEAVVRRFMEFVKDDSLHPSTFDLGRMLTRVVARESKAQAGTGDAPAAGQRRGDRGGRGPARARLREPRPQRARCRGAVRAGLDRGRARARCRAGDGRGQRPRHVPGGPQQPPPVLHHEVGWPRPRAPAGLQDRPPARGRSAPRRAPSARPRRAGPPPAVSVNLERFGYGW